MPSSSSPSADRPIDQELLRRFLQASRRARILALVNGARSQAELAELVVRELCEAFDAELALVLAADAGTGSPRVLGSAGIAVEERARLRLDVPGRALLARVSHVARGPDLLGLGARWLVSAPFEGAAGERGAIVLACLDDRQFDDADLALLESVADGVGRALARHRYAETLEQRVETLQAVFRRAPVAMLVVDSHLRIVDASDAACALLGRARDALAELRLGDLAADEPYAAPPGRRSLLSRGAPATEVRTFLRGDGSRFEAEVTVTTDAAAGLGVLVLRDVDETMTISRTIGFDAGVPSTL